MAARLNIDQADTNLIEQGFDIFSHGQPDQIVNYVRANLPVNHLALIYFMIRTMAQREKHFILPKHKRKWVHFYDSCIKVSNFKDSQKVNIGGEGCQTFTNTNMYTQ